MSGHNISLKYVYIEDILFLLIVWSFFPASICHKSHPLHDKVSPFKSIVNPLVTLMIVLITAHQLKTLLWSLIWCVVKVLS